LPVYDLNEILEKQGGEKYRKYSAKTKKTIASILGKVLYVDKVNNFFATYNNPGGDIFLESAFEHFGYEYIISDEDKVKIPKEGRLIITSNHPLGGLDGVALLKAIRDVRSDTKVLANNVLSLMPNTEEIFLPVDVFNKKTARDNILKISEALKNEEALLFFPSAKVSRLGFHGIKDPMWQRGAISYAHKYNVPILPIHLKAKNSFSFYILAKLHPMIGTIRLPRELFNKKGEKLDIAIGDIISPDIFKKQNFQKAIDALYKYTYKLRYTNERYDYEV